MNAAIGYRPLRYGIFTAGLLLAGMSFFVYFGNGLAGEATSHRIADFGRLGMIAGSIVAGMAIIAGALMSRQFVTLGVVTMGGLSSAVGGWAVGSLLFLGGSAHLERMIAVCLAPVGMWLGLLAGASGNRVVVGSAVGGTICAILGAIAFPLLFNMDGPPDNNAFWTLVGLLIGGFFGNPLGAFIAWSRSEPDIRM